MILGISGVANAELTVIGTATNSAGSYNMVWEHDTDGTSLVWLDMTTLTTWQGAMDWAAGLDSTMTYNFDPGYSVEWTDTQWRLPETEDRVSTLGMVYGTVYGDTNASYGYHIPGEASHLFYVGLGNLGARDRDGNLVPPEDRFTNAGPFENLPTSYVGIWLATTTDWFTYPDHGFLTPDDGLAAYYYKLGNGDLAVQRLDYSTEDRYAFAVRSADITVVPEPMTMSMLAMGGLALIRRRRTA